MKRLVAVLALLVCSCARDDAAPYKLVVVWNEQGIAIADYPTQARCEAAVKFIAERTKREREVNQPVDLPGVSIVPPKWDMTSFCMPA